MRECLNCGTPISGHGRRKYCTDRCRKLAFESRNPARHRERWIRLYEPRAQRMERIKDFIYKDKVLKGCSKCPERRPNCLQYHHIDPTKKTFAISDMRFRRYGLETIKEEMAKCILLCANCHAVEENGDGFRAEDRLIN